MKTMTVTKFGKDVKKHLTKLKDDQDMLVLAGPGEMNFVILTLETYNSMEETAYLFSTKANSKRLLQSFEDVKAGRVFIKRLNLDDAPTSRKSRVARKTVKLPK